MIDLKFLRENPEIVKQNIRNKFQDSKLPLVDEVIELDAQARATQQEADDLRASRNKISKEIGGLMAKGLREEAEAKLNKKMTNYEKITQSVESLAEFIETISIKDISKERIVQWLLKESDDD